MKTFLTFYYNTQRNEVKIIEIYIQKNKKIISKYIQITNKSTEERQQVQGPAPWTTGRQPARP